MDPATRKRRQGNNCCMSSLEWDRPPPCNQISSMSSHCFLGCCVLGGPSIAIPFGRKDARNASSLDADRELPPASSSVDMLLGVFKSYGMNVAESVAILGKSPFTAIILPPSRTNPPLPLLLLRFSFKFIPVFTALKLMPEPVARYPSREHFQQLPCDFVSAQRTFQSP